MRKKTTQSKNAAKCVCRNAKSCYTMFMKYPAVFSPIIRILLWLIVASVLIATVLGALALCGVQIEMTIARAKLFVACSPMALIAALLATMHYKVTATHVELRFAFWDVLNGRINVENILNIVKKDDKLYVSYLWKGVDPVISEITISPKRFKEMVKDIKAQNPTAVYINEDEK